MFVCFLLFRDLFHNHESGIQLKDLKGVVYHKLEPDRLKKIEETVNAFRWRMGPHHKTCTRYDLDALQTPDDPNRLPSEYWTPFLCELEPRR